MTSYLAEIFPGIDASDFQLVSNISLNGGRANKGDVVAFFANGEMEVGELIVSVAADDAIFCFVAKWQKIEFEGFWLTCRVSDNDLCKIPCKYLDTVFTHCMSKQRKSCSVYLPPELRP
jgi:hypothetical protein